MADDKGTLYAEGLSRLIKAKTVTYSDEKNFEDFRNAMKEVFPLVSEKLTCVRTVDNALLYKWKGESDQRPALLMGHQDVVPAEEGNWKYPPFDGVIAEDRVWGRGAMDCKGTVFCEFMAVEELLQEGFVPKQDIYLAVGDSEEMFGEGARATAKYLMDNGIKPFFILDEGGLIVDDALPGMKKPFCVIGVYEKGYADVKFIAKGKGGHSSTPSKNNPMARLAKFIVDVEKRDRFAKYMDEETEEMLYSLNTALKFPLNFLLKHIKFFKPLIVKALPKFSSFGNALLSTTIVFTQSGGSDAPNVIPQEAYAIANLRFSKHQGGEECYEILRKVAAQYDVEMEILNTRDASKVVKTDKEGYKFVKKCALEYFPDYGVAPYVIMGGTDCRFYEDVCECNMRFTPLLLSDGQLAAMHSANESIDIKALVSAVGFYKKVLTDNK